jgi:peptidoglycan biosynthesis protein MviN/MurJ (putative lipid II flippase)
LPRILIIDGFYFSSFLINPLATDKGQITAYDIGISIQSSFFILVTALGTIFFPDLAKIFFNPKVSKTDFWHKLFKYLKISVGLGVAITLFTLIISPLVMYIYTLVGKGQGNTGLIVMIAQISSFSLIFRSAKEILSKYFYVQQSVWIPVILSTLAILVQTLFTLVFYFSFGKNASLATTLGFIANEFTWLLLAIFYVRKDYRHFQKHLSTT